MADNLAGTILSEVSRSFDLRSLEIFNVSKVVAGEFYEVYRGVVAPSEFTGMVEQLTSGPCLVMELASKCVHPLTATSPGFISRFSLGSHRDRDMSAQWWWSTVHRLKSVPLW